MSSSWPSYTGENPWADEVADLAVVADPGPLTKGVPNPEQPGHWLVTPWPQGASYCTVVGHFLRWLPHHSEWTNAGLMVRYYRAFQAALDVAPTHELIYACDRSWAEQMQRCIARCVEQYQAEWEAARQRASLKTTTSGSAGRRGRRPNSATVRTLRPVGGFRETGS